MVDRDFREIELNDIDNNVDLNDTSSEEVQEIMGQMPHWIIRRGVNIIFLIVLLLFVFAYFMRYPDIIETKITITLDNPPVKIVSHSSGRIQKLFVQNNQIIAKGDPICLLENSADYQDILHLKKMFLKLDSTIKVSGNINELDFNQNFQLGELQSEYAELHLLFHQYKFFVNQGLTTKKISHLKKQVKFVTTLDEEILQKEALLKKQLSIEIKKFAIDSLLRMDSITTTIDYYNAHLKFISQQITTNDNKFSLLENKIQQSEYLKNIFELEQTQIQLENDFKNGILESLRRLNGAYAIWEQKYLLKAPTAGKVTFFKFWQENQYVEMSEAIILIVPLAKEYLCKAVAPVLGAGKISNGQKVLIKLSAYPYQEFGIIMGEIKSISEVALDDNYSIEIKLTNGLTTTKKKQIPSYSLLNGTGEVLTQNKSILERIFEKLIAFNQYN